MPHFIFPYSIGFYAVSIPAVFMTNLSKGGFGMGLGVVAVPLMALFLPIHNVVAILLPILFWTDLIALWEYRGQWDRTILRTAIPAAVCGIGIGVLTFHRLHETWLRLGIGLTDPFRCSRRVAFVGPAIGSGDSAENAEGGSARAIPASSHS